MLVSSWSLRYVVTGWVDDELGCCWCSSRITRDLLECSNVLRGRTCHVLQYNIPWLQLYFYRLVYSEVESLQVAHDTIFIHIWRKRTDSIFTLWEGKIRNYNKASFNYIIIIIIIIIISIIIIIIIIIILLLLYYN